MTGVAILPTDASAGLNSPLKPHAWADRAQARRIQPGTPTTPVSSISAGELHELLLRAHASGNVARKRFIDALRALSEQRLYLQLGYPDVVGYAEATFRYRKSQTYEFLRVSEALEVLPEVAAAFELGELSWSLVAELTRVAASDTEEEWLEFARMHRVAETIAEIKDALRKNRKSPRKNGNGLPGLPVRLRLEFSPEDYAILERGLEKVADEMSGGLDGARAEPEKVLLYLMDRMLHSETAGDSTAGRVERVDSPYTVVFHRCTDCHRAAVESSRGRVEISTEALERVGGGARRIDIDPEKEVPPEKAAARATGAPEQRDAANTPALRRALCARAGGRCENPFCRRETGEEEGHGHHLRLRSRGGATALWNEAWICRRCHSLVHAGALVVEGDPLAGLEWTPRAADLARRMREELERTRALPQVRLVEAASLSGHPENPEGASALGPASEMDDAIAGLVELGWTKAQATTRVTRALERLAENSGEAVDVTRVLAEAVRS